MRLRNSVSSTFARSAPEIVAESWSFSGATPSGGAASVVSASQFTVPVTAIVPVTSGWALDAYVAYAHGSVTVDRGGSVGKEQLTLSGVNDAKLRLVGKLHGDNLMLTLGASLPSGTTALGPQELEALSVLASPALRFRTPTLGNGASGTGGLVVAGEKGAWALAMAGSFEKRADYAPAEALTSGLGRPALRAGDAIHISFGADRLLQAARQTFSLIGDVYTNGSLRDPSQTVNEVGFISDQLSRRHIRPKLRSRKSNRCCICSAGTVATIRSAASRSTIRGALRAKSGW